MFAGAGLALLFLLRVLGGEGSGLIKQYARSLSSVKLGVAELSFASRSRAAGIGSHRRPFRAPAKETYAAGGTERPAKSREASPHHQTRQGLFDRDIHPKAAGLGRFRICSVDDLRSSETFTQSTIALPLQCLSAWFEQSADSGPVERYLASYSNVFRRLASTRSPSGRPRPGNRPEGVRSRIEAGQLGLRS